EIHARAFAGVSAHGLTQHREPGLRMRQAAIHAPPACATIAGAVDRRLAAALLWHGVADALPAPTRAIQAVDAAVILLVEPRGSRRVLHHAMWIVTERHARVGQEIRRTA